ncbi:MAG: glycoside hydrolase [Christiangramia sp.]|nr:glycoside hydrolase [Christiangramia sp.]
MTLPNKHIKLFIYIVGAFVCSCQADIPFNAKKLNGLSLVASRDSLTKDHIEKILDINSNAVALMPFAFIRDTSEPELYFNLEKQWFGERVQGIEQAIKLLHEKNIKVMIKPHIWIRNGQFTGDLDFSSEADWKKFESSYREYILLYASIAAEHNVELFCIGTELFNFVNERPEFWKDLIAELRMIYNGKLVYAENWDKVDKTDIWEDLDYIGADAYFPLSEKISPNQEEIQEGWKQHKEMLKDLSSTHRIPVMFTEYGYRSVDFALKEPWNSEREISSINHNLQARALLVIYEEFWTENWFAGGFLWKWHQHEEAGGIENNRFTPQNKPAEKVVREYYRRFRN